MRRVGPVMRSLRRPRRDLSAVLSALMLTLVLAPASALAPADTKADSDHRSVRTERIRRWRRASGFIGLFAPAGTPAPVIKKLSREVAAILATPSAQVTARTLTAAVADEDDETFARFLAGESVKWKQALASLDLSQ
jgi:hypothetical protein